MTCPHTDILAVLHAHQGHCDDPADTFPIIDEPTRDDGWASDRECDEAAARHFAPAEPWGVWA